MQVVYHVVDSLGVSQPETIEKASEPITNLFVEGGLAGMIAITVLLICLFFAAWKAPKCGPCVAFPKCWVSFR